MEAPVSTAGFLAPAKSSSLQVRTVTAAALGTVFEWYDFTLYGAMASILAAKFFSGLNPSLGFIFALLTFGVGFVVRPIGAIVFGRLGDLVGRKRTFMITIVIMGGATFGVGLLPVYATAGTLAPVLLISLRILQGLALGGEYGGAVIYVTEHVDRGKRGLSTSFIQMTGSLGLIVALVVIQTVQASTTQASFDTWAWRLPFLLSIILLAASVRIRQRMHESPVFKKMQEEKRLSTSPVRETFGRANLRQLAVALFGLGGGMAVIVYNALFYPLFFLTQTLKLPSATANLVTMAATVLCIPLFCLAGWLSDRFGRKPVVLAGFVLAIATTFPIFHGIAHLANPALEAAQASSPVSVQTVPGGCSFMFNPIGNRRFTSPCDVSRQALSAASVTYTTADDPEATETVVHVGNRVIASNDADHFNQAQFTHDLGDALKQAGYGAAANPDGTQQIEIIGLLLLLLFCMTLGYGPVAVAMAEMFPARIRYTAMSFPYHFASGWIGGLLPTFSFAIAAAQGNIFAGLWYAVTWMIIGSVITFLFYHERRGPDLE